MIIDLSKLRNIWFYISQFFNHANIQSGCYCFGRKYELEEVETRLKQDVKAKFYMCYRSGFKSIDSENKYKTDVGWGCMVRCIQMLLANGIYTIRLGNDPNWEDGLKDGRFMNTLSMFLDMPESVLSIHNFCNYYENAGRRFGSSSGSKIAAKLVSDAELDFVILCWEYGIMKGDVEKACLTPEGGWKPAILMVYNQMLMRYMDSCFINTMKKILQVPQCIGILGGTYPDHAIYIVGFHDDKLLYYDPHMVRAATENAELDEWSYHTAKVYSVLFTKILSSFSFAFLCRTKEEYEQLMPVLKEINTHNEMFLVSEESSGNSNNCNPDEYSIYSFSTFEQVC